MIKRNFTGITALFFALLVASPIVAQLEGTNNVGEASNELWIDGGADVRPGAIPSNPDVAIDSSGRSIFVWNSFTSTRNEIYLRLFDTNNSPLGDPVLVNTLVESDQDRPRVAVSSDNSFLVIWQSYESNPNAPGFVNWVRSQAFDADGIRNGDEQLVSSHPSGEIAEISADVAALRDGGYIVTWKSSDSEGNDVNIWARRLGADGVPLADPFVVNSTIGQSEDQPTVTELSDGGFLVVWARPDIHGRRFMADGTPVGEDFEIDTFAGGYEIDPDAVLHSDGRVLVVWSDEDRFGIERFTRARLFSDQLVPQGDDFPLNTLKVNLNAHPRAGDYGSAGFFVVWEGLESAGDDNDPNSIQGRIVTGSNQFDGPQFQLNVWGTGSQEFPGIGGRNDRIGIAWDSDGNPEYHPDTDDEVITGQFWSVCGIFCDGFEANGD